MLGGCDIYMPIFYRPCCVSQVRVQATHWSVQKQYSSCDPASTTHADHSYYPAPRRNTTNTTNTTNIANIANTTNNTTVGHYILQKILATRQYSCVKCSGVLRGICILEGPVNSQFVVEVAVRASPCLEDLTPTPRGTFFF